MPLILLAILILVVYILYGKKFVQLVGKKVLSIIAIIVFVIFFIKSGLLGGFGRIISFLILKIQEFIGSF